MLTFGFYNSNNHDRTYDTRQISELFNGLINDGVFASIGTSMIVNAISEFTVGVGKGRAWFNSTWSDNDSIFPITLESPEIVFDRYDTIVLEVNESPESRTNAYKILKGLPSVTPVPADIIETSEIHQHILCHIIRRAGSTSISDSDIDNRVGTSDCPFVTGILDTVNIDELMVQWDSQWNDWKAAQASEHNSWEQQYREDAEEAASSFQQASETTFFNWLNNLQNQLDSNQVTNLQAQIDAMNLNAFYRYYDLLERTIVVNKDVKGEATSLVETSSEMSATTTFVKTNGVMSQISTLLVPVSGAFKYQRTINIVEDFVARKTTMTELVVQSPK